MNIIFLGPPGSGKGTQSDHITKMYHIPQISTGDIIRKAVREGTSLGKQFQALIDKGQLVPDDLVNLMVETRLSESDCSSGFLLDGYPRTLPQAEALDAMLARKHKCLDAVLLLCVDDSILFERITGRRSDPETGHVYHILFDPPPAWISARLIQRSDDSEDVLSKRLKEYHAKTAPLIPYYENKGLLKRIDGLGTFEEIQKRIDAVLIKK